LIMELKVGDIILLKKKHPCGNEKWEIVRLGTDVRIKCLKCRHQVVIRRSVLEDKIRSVNTGNQ
jgi:hypothetical protein